MRPVESTSIVAVSTPLERGTFTSCGRTVQGSKRLSAAMYWSDANCELVPLYKRTCATSPTSLTSACVLVLLVICWVCVQLVPLRRNTEVPEELGITVHHWPAYSKTFDCGFSPVDCD